MAFNVSVKIVETNENEERVRYRKTSIKEEERKKPVGWTQAEFELFNEGWTGPLERLIDIVRKSGPLVKVKTMWGGPHKYLYFENIILDVANDPRNGGILAEPIMGNSGPDANTEATIIGYSVLFTHGAKDVRCSIEPDGCYSRDDKQIYLCRAFSVLESPGFESDDDMDEFQVRMDNFGKKFKSLALPEPVKVDFFF